MHPPSGATPPASWRTLALLIAGYGVAVWVGLQLLLEPSGLSIFWPASGIALAGLLTIPRRQWWILIAGWFLVHAPFEWVAGFPQIQSLAYPLISLGSAALGAFLIRRTTPSPFDMSTSRSVFALCAWPALLSVPLGAFLASALQSIGQDASAYWIHWRVWWTSDVLGQVVVAPLVLSLSWLGRAWRDATTPQRLETIVALAGVVVLSQAILGSPPEQAWIALSLLVLPYPILIGLALRAGVGGVSIALTAIGVLLAWHTVHGMGPFVVFASDPARQLVVVQVYLASVVLPSLFLAASASEARATSSHIREIYDHSSEAIWLVGVRDDGSFVHEALNPRAMAATAHLTSPIGRTPQEIYPPAAAETFVKRVRACIEHDGPVTFDVATDIGNGTHVWHTSLIPIRDGSGRIRRVAGFSRDVTERFESERERAALEKQLRLAQKMEAVGRLAGGLAHEFNNILTAIVGHANLLRDSMKHDPVRRESVDAILEGGSRAASLVRQVLLFSRPQELPRTPLRVQSVVSEAIRLLRATVPSTIEIRQSIDVSCPPVLADATQVHQVLINLASNAAYAMRAGHGVLGVHLSHVTNPGTADYTGMSAVLPTGPYVCLAVSDTGPGMSAETLEQIYEPFYTTKPAGEGTGLGIPVVLGIMRSHEGGMAIESIPGGGTTVRVFFPVQTGREEALPEGDIAVAHGGGERVLFVDDEPSLVRLGEQMLQALGYSAVACASAEAALAALRESGTNGFDALITDYTMPGMTGLQLALESKRTHPGLPVVLATGVPLAQENIRAAGIAVEGVLVKPYTMADLGEALARALMGRPYEGAGRR